MCQQPPRRHLLALGELALGEMPGLEQRVDVGVERDLALLGETQESAGKYWFADRAGEEERRGVDGFAAAECRDAVAPGEHHALVVDDGNADARHVVGAHALEELHRDIGLAVHADAVSQMVLDGRGILSGRGAAYRRDETR